MQGTEYLLAGTPGAEILRALNSPAYLIPPTNARWSEHSQGYPAGLMQAGRMRDVVQTRLPFTPIRFLFACQGHVLLLAASTQPPPPQQTDGDAE